MIKHAATLPNGKTVTRNSKTRRYAFCVAGFRSAATVADNLTRQAQIHFDRGTRCMARVKALQAGADLTLRSDGTPMWGSREGEIQSVAKLFSQTLSSVAQCREKAAEAQDVWEVIGWSQSDRAALQMAARARNWDDIALIDATVA